MTHATYRRLRIRVARLESLVYLLTTALVFAALLSVALFFAGMEARAQADTATMQIEAMASERVE